ncbi:hypothetical protein [Nocardioides montaniterrae]
MSAVRPLALLVLSLLVVGCGSLSGPTESSSSAQDRGARAARLLDQVVAAIRDHTGGTGSEGLSWGGGWQECTSYVGHEVEFRGQGSWDVPGGTDGLAQAVADRLRADGWTVSSQGGRLTVTGDGVHGALSIADRFVSLRAGTGCIGVSAATSSRLLALEHHG